MGEESFKEEEEVIKKGFKWEKKENSMKEQDEGAERK